MNKIAYILITLIILISCQPSNDSQKNSAGLDMGTYYIEKKLSFFDPYEITYAGGKFQGYTYETWVRQPENLSIIHETFKKVGYKRIFDSNWFGFFLDVNKPTKELIDSLIITHDSSPINSKYYSEFWDRRMSERNDSVVFEILKEVSNTVYYDSVINIDNSLVNDTLYNLINIREYEDSLTDKKAIENFNYLKSIEMHYSAYNLLYERYRYYDINWNQEELRQDLKIDTMNCCPSAFIEDDTK
ncbi:MAG: hypothetical protein KAG84_07135 [Bacteroidales bacterium]|nr:hypothetical protein [Bacteroidales bacterium]